MFTIIGADGKEYGPVTAEKIQEWIAAGRANAQTQTRREGDAAWSTLGSLPEFAASFGAQPPPMPGAAPAAAPAAAGAIVTRTNFDTKAYAAAIHASGARVDVFGCLAQSFDLWKKNFLPLVGVTALILLVQFVIGMVPLVGALAGLFLNGVFYGGLYYYYLGKMRGQPREVADGFAGFTRSLGSLVLSSLLQSAIFIGFALVFMAPLIGFFMSIALAKQGGVDALPVLAPPTIAWISIGALVMLYFAVAVCFTFALVIDKGLGPWDALVTSWRVVTRHWFAVFFTLLLGFILSALGVILLFIGVLLTMPLWIGAILYAYEALFNTPEANAALEAATTRH